MGLFAFIKEAGEKLFRTGEANAAAADPAAANARAAQAIHNYIVALK
ncbi:MAG: peptidoglycan-binding protein LysM, partial [Proteobacteria bacterium]|nr:peptidoglycan-binding protein LysM [Pseudomonadota bacterium]